MIDFASSLDDLAIADLAPCPASASREERRVRRRKVEAVGEEIARLSAHITAATYRLLVMIRQFDASEGWHEAGFRSCAKWLSWKTGISPGAAREKVRVARALAELPVLSDALRRGRLSYLIARALTRVATPDNEAELVEVARHSTAAQMERLVSAWKRSERAEKALLSEEGLRHRERTVCYGTDPGDGSWGLRGRWDPEAGAVLEKAIEAAADLLWRRAGEAADRPAGARRADALVLVAEAALGEGLGKVLEDGVAGEGDEEGEASSPSPVPVVSRASPRGRAQPLPGDGPPAGLRRLGGDDGPRRGGRSPGRGTEAADRPGRHRPGAGAPGRRVPVSGL